MVATPYTLSLYLMYMPEDALEKTFFCVYDQIKDDITCKLPHVRTFYSIANADKKTFWRFRLSSIFRYFFIRFTDIYAMDFLDFTPQLIGRSKYTSIEDGAGNFTYGQYVDVFKPFALPRTWWGFKRRLQHGPVYGKTMGTNRQCINRLITSPEDITSPLLQGKKFTLVDLHAEWQNASETKKNNIKYVFNITESIFLQAKECKTILLTQPLQTDGMTTEEMIELYRKYINKYVRDGVVIKPHPIEQLDYGKLFPQAVFLKTRIPMQLLSVMGITFDRALTPYSTAVSALPSTTEIEWIGMECNELIAKKTKLVMQSMTKKR